MKKSLFVMGILAFVLVFGMTVLGCSDSDDGGSGANSGGNDGSLNGTWTKYINNVYTKLTISGSLFTMSAPSANVSDSGTISYTGSTFEFRPKSGGTVTGSYSLSGKNLTISNCSNPIYNGLWINP